MFFFTFDMSFDKIKTAFFASFIFLCFNNQLIVCFQKIISSCYRTVLSGIWEILSEFLIFCNLFHEASEIIAKYEKRGKYLPIFHEATCENYFIVKCLLKLNTARAVLLTNFLLNVIKYQLNLN